MIWLFFNYEHFPFQTFSESKNVSFLKSQHLNLFNDGNLKKNFLNKMSDSFVLLRLVL